MKVTSGSSSCVPKTPIILSLKWTKLSGDINIDLLILLDDFWTSIVFSNEVDDEFQEDPKETKMDLNNVDLLYKKVFAMSSEIKVVASEVVSIRERILRIEREIKIINPCLVLG